MIQIRHHRFLLDLAHCLFTRIFFWFLSRELRLARYMVSTAGFAVGLRYGALSSVTLRYVRVKKLPALCGTVDVTPRRRRLGRHLQAGV